MSKRKHSAKAIPERHVDLKQRPKSDPEAGWNAPLRFRFWILEEGDHPLHTIGQQDHKRLLRRLQHLEKMTLRQARDSHDISILGDLDRCPNKTLAPRVNRCLESVQASDGSFDGTFAEIRIAKSEAPRFMGFIDYSNGMAEFHLLWWDPNHELWPEGKTRR